MGLGQGTREALMGQVGAQAGGDVLHRGGWVERPVRLYRDEWGILHQVGAFATAGPPAYRERSSREDRGLRTDR